MASSAYTGRHASLARSEETKPLHTISMYDYPSHESFASGRSGVQLATSRCSEHVRFRSTAWIAAAQSRARHKRRTVMQRQCTDPAGPAGPSSAVSSRAGRGVFPTSRPFSFGLGEPATVAAWLRKSPPPWMETVETALLMQPFVGWGAPRAVLERKEVRPVRSDPAASRFAKHRAKCI